MATVRRSRSCAMIGACRSRRATRVSIRRSAPSRRAGRTASSVSGPGPVASRRRLPIAGRRRARTGRRGSRRDLHGRPELRAPGESAADPGLPARPLIYGKAAVIRRRTGACSPGIGRSLRTSTPRSSSASSSARLPTPSAPAEAMTHVFGYTCINDVSSRDPWLDGDQWLHRQVDAGLLPGRPVGRHARRARHPTTCASAAPSTAIADPGRPTASMRFSIAEIDRRTSAAM